MTTPQHGLECRTDHDVEQLVPSAAEIKLLPESGVANEIILTEGTAQTTQSKKRDRSPKTVHATDERRPRKIKSPNTSAFSTPHPVQPKTSPNWDINIEAKLSEPPPTPGNTELPDSSLLNVKNDADLFPTITSGEPKPGSSMACNPQSSIPPRWAQQMVSTVEWMSKEINALTNKLTRLPKELEALNEQILEIRMTLSHNRNSLQKPDPNTITQPENTKTTSFSAKPSIPTTQPRQSNQINSMDIDSPEPITLDSVEHSLPPHASFLHECFQRRIGLSPNQRTNTTITSFDGEYIATGFNRVLPTYQGYYVELEHSDILWNNLEKLENPDSFF